MIRDGNLDFSGAAPLAGQADVDRTVSEYSRSFFKSFRRNPFLVLYRVAKRRLNEKKCAAHAACPQNGFTVMVPSELRPPSYEYRGFKGPWLEEHFFKAWREKPSDKGAAYLPIFFDSFFFHTHSFCYLPSEFRDLYQKFWRILETLEATDRAYFTVLGMYDFPIWDWHRFPRNIIVAASAGCGDYPIPLLKGDRKFSPAPKNIRISFMGALGDYSNALNVRSEMKSVFAELAHFGQGGDWEDVMARSTFSLCPRGQAPTSFRLFEALSVQSIPVYIWKESCWLPFADELDWSAFAFVLEAGKMAEAKTVLCDLPPDKIRQMQERIAEVYPQYFTYDAVCSRLKDKMKGITGREAAEALTAARRLA